ncbi:MAG: CHAD domain-containing protein [Polyangiaceae bacterium]|nr:CHAD domain-containing protein [Polyangiaceae bacterium]
MLQRSASVAYGATLALGSRVLKLVAGPQPREQHIDRRHPTEPPGFRTKVASSWRQTLHVARESGEPASIVHVLMALLPTHRAHPPRGILHLSRRVEQRLAQLRTVKQFAATEDPVEAVHQLRVASRRIRTFVDLFGPYVDPGLVESLHKPLCRITRAVRELRDTDVQMARLRTKWATTSDAPQREALGYLLDRAKERRRKLARRAQRALSRQSFDALAPPLREMLDAVALRARAPSMTYGVMAELAFRPVVEAARAAVPHPLSTEEAEQWHRFRLALKRFRYAAELLEPELGASYLEMQRRLKKLQESLGDYQDSVLFEQAVLKHTSRLDDGADSELVRGLRALVVRSGEERHEHLARCREHCALLAGPQLFATIE